MKDDTLYLVLEFMGKGNLAEYCRTRGRGIITKKNQINYATYVWKEYTIYTCAINFLEIEKIIV